MKFLKRNSSEIIKLLVDQIGIVILSLSLYTPIAMIDSDDSLFNKMRIGVSVFAVIFYFFIIYNVVWEMGAKDKIRIDGGRMEKKKSRGFLLGLYANIPNIVLSLLTILLLSIDMIRGTEALTGGTSVFYIITTVWEALYMGFIQGVTNHGGLGLTETLIECLLYLFIPFISMLVTHFAYSMGLKDKKIINFKKTNKQ